MQTSAKYFFISYAITVICSFTSSMLWAMPPKHNKDKSAHSQNFPHESQDGQAESTLTELDETFHSTISGQFNLKIKEAKQSAQTTLRNTGFDWTESLSSRFVNLSDDIKSFITKIVVSEIAAPNYAPFNGIHRNYMRHRLLSVPAAMERDGEWCEIPESEHYKLFNLINLWLPDIALNAELGNQSSDYETYFTPPTDTFLKKIYSEMVEKCFQALFEHIIEISTDDIIYNTKSGLESLFRDQSRDRIELTEIYQRAFKKALFEFSKISSKTVTIFLAGRQEDTESWKKSLMKENTGNEKFHLEMKAGKDMAMVAQNLANKCPNRQVALVNTIKSIGIGNHYLYDRADGISMDENIHLRLRKDCHPVIYLINQGSNEKHHLRAKTVTSWVKEILKHL
ncbi:hypothetical protein CI610_00214 [invertebrate metagenome]|uniref:Uncharacterized protein n=1 Tax=invertebrate metagenome TaxID=1711999 RepID=A0A2H9TC75_9ZZZZ